MAAGVLVRAGVTVNGNGDTMSDEQLWTDRELRDRADDLALGYSLPLDLIRRIENALIVMRSESEAERAKLMQRIDELEQDLNTAIAFGLSTKMKLSELEAQLAEREAWEPVESGF